jgi:hypothetical protein
MPLVVYGPLTNFRPGGDRPQGYERGFNVVGGGCCPLIAAEGLS